MKQQMVTVQWSTKKILNLFKHIFGFGDFSSADSFNPFTFLKNTRASENPEDLITKSYNTSEYCSIWSILVRNAPTTFHTVGVYDFT
jgi:hypothetical protein